MTYFLDDDEFDNSEEDPFSLSWDTTGTPDGVHTLKARLTKFDSTEIFSDPITFTVSNAPPPTPLEAWRGQHFSAADLADPAKEATVWGDDADPDRDGNWNWKEYAFGGDPLDPSDGHLDVSAQVTDGPGGRKGASSDLPSARQRPGAHVYARGGGRPPDLVLGPGLHHGR